MMQIRTHKKRGIILVTFLSIVLVLTLTACASNSNAGSAGNTEKNNTGSTERNNVSKTQNNESTEAAKVIKEGESLVIPISGLSETAQFYFVAVDGTRMGVVAVKTPDGETRTAFDTCQVCNGSPRAYFKQSGNTLQCQNCGNKFLMDRVEVEAGGCNPIPIFEKDKTVTDEAITISYDTLKANKSLFPSNWRQ